MGMMVEDKILMMPPSAIKPYIRNPRKNDKTVDMLCKIIPRVGFNVPLVIDENGIIVKGHARFSAAIRLGMEEIPCIITHADPESIKADRILDNKISEFSEWINDEVLREIESIDLDIDFSEFGFPSVKMDDIPVSVPVEGVKFEPADDEVPVIGSPTSPIRITPVAPKKKYYKCICPDCGHIMFVEESEIFKYE